MIAALLFLTCPAFGQSFLWITGAANYLYGILIILCFLLPYRKQADNNTCKYSLLFEISAAILWFLFGIIAGWTNENTAVAMIVMIIGYIFFFRIKSIKLHAWNITGCIGGIIGCVLMLSAPGTAKRLDTAGGSGGIVFWLKRAIFYSCDMIQNFRFILLLFVILLTIYIYQHKNHIHLSKGMYSIKRLVKDASVLAAESGVVIIYLLGFLASVYSMIVSPQFPGRAWSGPAVFLLITTTNLAAFIDMSDFKMRIGKNIALGFVLILFLPTYLYAYLELKNIDAAYYARVAAIETAVASSEKSVTIPNICGWSGYSCYDSIGDLNDDSAEWPNTALAKYYEVQEIICSD